MNLFNLISLENNKMGEFIEINILILLKFYVFTYSIDIYCYNYLNLFFLS